jgi:hypothetical protein
MLLLEKPEVAVEAAQGINYQRLSIDNAKLGFEGILDTPLIRFVYTSEWLGLRR